jgi:hypothetical protein
MARLLPLLALLTSCLVLTEDDLAERYDVDDDGWQWPDDCDDKAASVFPGASETCNGRDDDCDGMIDEEGTDGTSFYVDADGDGVGTGSPVSACAAPAGYVPSPGDCDDGDAEVSPLATELCNGADDDCDGETDNDASDADTLYIDADGDSYGSPEISVRSCGALDGYVANDADCDDGEPLMNPGLDEICGDTLDNDCNPVSDAACDLPPLLALADADRRWTSTGTEALAVAVGDLDDSGGLAVALGQPALGDPGRVWVLAPSEEGDIATSAWSSVTGVAGDGAGAALATGEVTGTGAVDLVIGAPYGSTGVVYVLAGPLDSSHDLAADGIALTGSSIDDAAGISLAAGDIDGDGRDDVIVGAPDADHTGADAGAAYLVRGPVSASGLSAFDRVTGAGPGDRAGFAVAAGDLDGDGVLEVAIGAPQHGGSAAGAVYVLSWASGNRVVTEGELAATGIASADRAGGAVAIVPDVDGDGLDDLLVGAVGDDSNGTGSGAAYLVRGGSSPTTLADADARLLGPSEGSNAGSSVTGLDGITELGLHSIAVSGVGTDDGAGSVWLLHGPVTGTFNLGGSDTVLQGEAGSTGGVALVGAHLTDDALSDLVVTGGSGIAWMVGGSGI